MSAFKPKYQFKDGAFKVANLDAQAVGEMCENLSSTIGLTPKTLLDANRADGTLLHDYFEWRDDVAAEKYREEQARYVIRSIIVVEENKPPVKAYCPVIVGKQRTFEHINTVVKSADLTAQMLENAKKELFAFQIKYSRLKDYVELSEVFTSIENLRKGENNGKIQSR